MKSTKFICDKCGECCKHLNLYSELYSELDKGNGVCRYLDESSNLCTIFENRPLICRVKEGYSIYFNNISYDEYIEITIKACELLKQHKCEFEYEK